MDAIVKSRCETIGRRIRRARLAAGLSHDRLAERVGTSRHHLIRLEKGRHLPRPEMLAKIAEATDRDVAYFEAVTEDEDDEESDVCVVLTSALRRFVRAEVRTLA